MLNEVEPLLVAVPEAAISAALAVIAAEPLVCAALPAKTGIEVASDALSDAWAWLLAATAIPVTNAAETLGVATFEAATEIVVMTVAVPLAVAAQAAEITAPLAGLASILPNATLPPIGHPSELPIGMD